MYVVDQNTIDPIDPDLSCFDPPYIHMDIVMTHPFRSMQLQLTPVKIKWIDPKNCFGSNFLDRAI